MENQIAPAIRMRSIFPTFAAVTALLLTASPLVALDVDDNGVSDVWQWYFDVPANQDLSLDSDGDGRTNREEAEKFTDPFDINDFLGMHNLLFDQSQGLMSFEASPVFGVDQELEFSFDLEDWFFQNSVVGNPDGSPSEYTVQAFNYEDMFWRLRFSYSNLEDDDADGLKNFEEAVLGTSSQSEDTDGDGYSDRAEFVLGTWLNEGLDPFTSNSGFSSDPTPTPCLMFGK